MAAYKYLIIGGGLTADATVRGIRKVDPGGSIGMVSMEPDPPYTRPSLSKGLWKGKAFEKIWRKTADLGVDLHLGRTITTLDLPNKTVVDDQKTVYSFDKLLLATGGTPRRLLFGGEDVIYYRTLADYQKLRKLTAEHQNFLVIGGGFIGAEIAAALSMNNKHVVIVFPEDGIGARIFSHSMSIFLNDFYRSKGVEVLPEHLVKGIERRGDSMYIKLHDQENNTDKELSADGVVAGVGIQPNIELAKAAGIDTGNGILVDKFLQTSQPDVYSAGDVASFYNPILDTQVRLEHEDNAISMGMCVGQNMAGEHNPYDHLPYFYSDLFELGYEAVGELDSQKEIVVDWKEIYKKGVVYYLSNNRVRGVLLWNVWGKIDAARDVIAAPGPINPTDLLNKIPA